MKSSPALRLPRAVAVAAFAVLTLACAHADAAWNAVRGSGHVVTEQRVVTGFQAVELKGSMNLVLRQGSREGVELRGDDNILPLVELHVLDHGGVPTLEISDRPGSDYSTSRPIVVTVDLKTLNKLSLAGSGDAVAEALKTPALRVTLSGSGNVRLTGLDTDTLTARVAGSGNIQLAGRAPHASFSIAGSGNVEAGKLESDDVDVRIAGSGDASVIARRTLAVNIAGSGDVRYSGDASVKQSVAGSGSVAKTPPTR